MNKFGLYEYAGLSLTDRLQLVWERGVFLHNVAWYSHGYNLYQLFDFYVEVVIEYTDTTNVITDAVPFLRGDRLNKYLDCIDLDKLVG